MASRAQSAMTAGAALLRALAPRQPGAACASAPLPLLGLPPQQHASNNHRLTSALHTNAAEPSPRAAPSHTAAAAASAAASSRTAPRRSFAADAAAAAEPNSHRASGPVPPGHLDSDLSPNACNIGLGRRRDLTMRQDLCLYGKNGNKVTLHEVLKGKRVILVGFPGGSICSQKHIPSYLQMSDKLKAHGVDKVLAVTVDTPENVKAMAEANKLTNPSSSGCKVDLLADKNGGLIRMLGLELGFPEDQGPRCQRFAGIVDDGLLLKLRIEGSPGQLELTDCKSMLELWKATYPNGLPNF